MEFRTILSEDSKSFVSDPGSPTLQEYEYHIDKSGKKQLMKKDSVINVYERIQADRDSTDINKLMERFALGETEALNINKGAYIDTRDMPKTYAEVFERGLECEQFFDGLPVDLKEMFDNSYSVFFTEMNENGKVFDEKVAKYNDRFVNHQFDERSDGSSGSVQTEAPKEISYHE